MIKWLIIWNIAVFLLYGYDKLAAKKKIYRISEKMLLFTALLFGGTGAFLGMEIFRHKTKHTSFKILVPLFCIINWIYLVFVYR